jgi:hypothetical protein
VKILIYSYDYNWRVGGIVVLHKLADLIAELGYETYIIGKNRISTRGIPTQIDLDLATRIAGNSDTVVIYPENLKGNPLKAKHVARWVLYFPGANGGDRTYDTNEFVFTYKKEFVADTIYSSGLVVRIVDTMVNHFFDMGLERNKDAILVKKGREDLEERTQYLILSMDSSYEVISADEMIENSESVFDFNLKLNQIRYFISFDHHTYHNTLAALAGCISIVVPSKEKSEDAFFSESPGRRLHISYGFQDSDQNQTDPRLLRVELDKIDSSNVMNAEKLAKSLQSHFKL